MRPKGLNPLKGGTEMKRPKRWVGPDQEMTILNADGTVAAEILQNDIQKLNRALYKRMKN